MAEVRAIRYLTPEEVADQLRVSRKTIYRWLTGGALAGQKIGRGWRISEQALSEFVQSQRGAA
jgi:excisionase family DNA binding protein